MTNVIWARLALVIVVALIFQAAVLDNIVLFGAHADVMVLVAVGSGLVAGAQRGAIVGFIVGCFADLLVDMPFGLSALTFVIIGFSCGLLRTVSAEHGTGSVEIGTCVVAGAVGTILYAVLGALVGQPGMLGRDLASAVFVVAIGGLLISWAVMWSLRWAFSGAPGSRSTTAVPMGGSAAG